MQGRFLFRKKHSGYPEKASAHLRVHSSLSLFYFLIKFDSLIFQFISDLFPINQNPTFFLYKSLYFWEKWEKKRKKKKLSLLSSVPSHDLIETPE